MDVVEKGARTDVNVWITLGVIDEVDRVVVVDVLEVVLVWAYVAEPLKTRMATVSKRIVPKAAREFILNSLIWVSDRILNLRWHNSTINADILPHSD